MRILQGPFLTSTLVFALIAPGGCSARRERTSGEPGAGTMSVTVRSQAFEAGGVIPKRHTGDGEDLSPRLAWSGLPAGTKELALVVDDPDAPSAEPWVHWVLYKIPPTTTELEEGIPPVATPGTPAGAVQGKNSWGAVGYRGPAPPQGHGTHHYHFKLYALDAALDLAPGLDKNGLLKALSGHVLGHGEVVGTYQR